MKKLLLFTVLAFALTATYGQGLYVKFGGGYAVPMGSQSLMEQSDAVQIIGNTNVVTTKTKIVKGSYGAGTLINGAVGYKFSPFIGIDLNISYQIGKEYSGNSSAESGANSVSINETKKSTGIFISPTMMFMAGSERVRPYALIGVIMGSVKIEDNTVAIYDVTDIPIVYDLKEETKGDMAFGFRGGIGVDVNINSRFTLYAEGVFNSMSYYAKESEIVSATVDGEDAMSDLSVSQKKTVYVDELTVTTVNGSDTADTTKPAQELSSPLPLSSLGVNIGLKIKLGSD